MVLIHPHAKERAVERGATEEEIEDTIKMGEVFPAKYGRTGFRKTTIYNDFWQGKFYYAKQLECYAVEEEEHWLVISLTIKYF